MTDKELIERYITERGVTRCPAAHVAPSRAVLSEADLAFHRSRPDPTTKKWVPRGVTKRGMDGWWARHKRRYNKKEE